MAYTAPTDLFTSEEAILSLASSIADEDRTNLGNGTINGALDVLADALAEQNVEVPPMNAGAILALAQYVTGGGGGSSDFTTAKLTFQKPAGAPLVCAYAGVDGVYPFIQDENGEVDVILYKGSAVAMYAAQGDITVSGDVTSDGGGMFTITGDGSIVIEQK